MSTSFYCIGCKNYQLLGKCKAFPKGIPNEILTGEKNHSKTSPKQKNNIIFDEIKD